MPVKASLVFAAWIVPLWQSNVFVLLPNLSSGSWGIETR